MKKAKPTRITTDIPVWNSHKSDEEGQDPPGNNLLAIQFVVVQRNLFVFICVRFVRLHETKSTPTASDEEDGS